MTLHDPTKVITGKVCPSCSREFSAGGGLTSCPHDNSLLSLVTADPYIGTVIADHYEITDVLGAGGWSVVYKAHHQTIKRDVAIKILHSHLVRDTDKVKRFQREAEAASSLLHPNVAAVFDYGMLPGGQPFIVMEYMEGVALSEVLESEGALPLERAVNLFVQACDGLAAAHDKGVVHRDIKPSNMFLTRGSTGEVLKILDFGLAKIVTPDEGQGSLTQTGETMGTPDYMSPEQCLGRQLDARTDIYTMGYVMYEVLTGKKAVSGKTTFDSMNSHIYEMPVPLAEANPQAKIGEAVEDVIFKALAKDPDNRYQRVLELRDALVSAVGRNDKPVSLFRKLMMSVQRSRARGSRKTAVPAIGLSIPLLVTVLLLVVIGKYYSSTMHTATAEGFSAPIANPAQVWKDLSTKAEDASVSGKIEQARRLWEEAEVPAQMLGEQSEEYATTLTRLKDVYLKLKQNALADNIQKRMDYLENRYHTKELGTIESNNEEISRLNSELLTNPGDKQVAGKLAHTLNNQAALFLSQGKEGQAMQLNEQAFKFVKQTLGDNDLEASKYYALLGAIKFNRGERDGVEDLFKRSLAIREQAHPPDNELLGRANRMLADYYRRTKQYDKSIEYGERALAIFEKTKGQDSDSYAWALNSLGATYMYKGDVAKADGYFTKAYRIRCRIAGADSPDAARSLMNVANINRMRGNYKTAEQQFTTAINNLEKVFGAKYVEVGICYLNLGITYYEAGDKSAAEANLKHALNLCLELQPKGESAVCAFTYLCDLYRAEHREDDARKLTMLVNGYLQKPTGGNGVQMPLADD